MELKKLSEKSLTQQPEEVFDILSKLGEGSYGSVYKALHKESSQVLAIKQVPVDTDLQDIIKEISIMQQCDSPYVVKYYGSYFKNTDLWIVMEYCGAGSVLDIMKLRGIYHNLPKGEVKTLTEEEIATILCDTLKGLEYLHLRKKIHRDIKAGNILLNSEGHSKLADFGVAGQLTDTMAKRNTVIGTPFWMAPEVIQEIGYDCVADIWSLGITALEMAEGKAPYGDIHPMRAMFMIPSRPPPSLREPDRWSPQFIDFVSRCLVKNPEERAMASELLQHEFIRTLKSPDVLSAIIGEAQQVRESIVTSGKSSAEENTLSSRTMVPEDQGTLLRTDSVDDGTMIQHATLVPDKVMADVESDLGTMVINEDEDEDSMRRHDSREYRPAFLDHFERKDREQQRGKEGDAAAAAAGKPAASDPVAPGANDAQLQRQLEQIAGGPQAGSTALGSDPENVDRVQKAMLEGEIDFSFLKYLSHEELSSRMANLDHEMEREIDDLRRRYHAKRQPILDAMDQKRKRQQKF